MTNRLLVRSETKQAKQETVRGGPRLLVLGILGLVGLAGLSLLAVPILIGTNAFFAASAGCSGDQTGTAGQPAAAAKAKSIPANYLSWYQKVGQQYGVPWTILAGIGTVESDNGQTTLPGVHSGSNAFGAAGPMQIGIGGAAGNVWGGLPVHPGSEAVNGVATDEDGGPNADVYDPADAIAGAAKYLLQAGVQTDPSTAIFAYNHLQSYVESVLYYASAYAGGNFSVVSAQLPSSSTAAGCAVTAGAVANISSPNQTVSAAISYAQEQIGKPYLFGGTGPDAFDCSGLVMMAYRAAGIDIARTSEEQWATEVRVPASQVEPGDLVFFAGSDGTTTAPGHVGLVIGNGEMIEAYATGFPIRVSTYGKPSSAGGDQDPVGFTRPWAKSGTVIGATGQPVG
ncbi:MAG: C40 family peptidase [Streptosporangiaceae bacterium]